MVKSPWATAYSAVWTILAAWALLLPATTLADDPPPPNPVSDAQPAKEQPAPDAYVCELLLAKHLDYLSLTDQQGQSVAFFRRDGSNMFLPPGRYSISEIHFQGGFSISPFGQPAEQITLVPGKNTRLDIGATLTSGVAVKREGRLLKLDYQLLDAGGRKYRRNDSDLNANPPQFAVYLDDEKIGSDKFEYG